MVVDKVHEIISFKLSKWFEQNIKFYTQKKLATNGFEKGFYILLINAFYGKTVESVSNRIKREFTRKNDDEKIIKQQ